MRESFDSNVVGVCLFVATVLVKPVVVECYFADGQISERAFAQGRRSRIHQLRRGRAGNLGLRLRRGTNGMVSNTHGRRRSRDCDKGHCGGNFWRIRSPARDQIGSKGSLWKVAHGIGVFGGYTRGSDLRTAAGRSTQTSQVVITPPQGSWRSGRTHGRCRPSNDPLARPGHDGNVGGRSRTSSEPRAIVIERQVL